MNQLLLQHFIYQQVTYLIYMSSYVIVIHHGTVTQMILILSFLLDGSIKNLCIVGSVIGQMMRIGSKVIAMGFFIVLTVFYCQEEGFCVFQILDVNLCANCVSYCKCHIAIIINFNNHLYSFIYLYYSLYYCHYYYYYLHYYFHHYY